VRDGIRFGERQVAIQQGLLRCTGWPRLGSLVQQVMGPIGLRYDHALVFPFEDAWDLLLEMSVVRHEAIRKRDALTAQQEVGRCRQGLHVLNLERIRLPAVARYFREPEAEPPTFPDEPRG
jgi:hypothetical protein